MQVEVRSSVSGRAPLVLLHGSNSDEHALLDLARAIAPDRTLISPRGALPSGSGYTFFRRLPDSSIDNADLRTRALELLPFILAIERDYGQKPLLLGFSSGAIMAAALLHLEPKAAAGAVLLRPQTPFTGEDFPTLPNLPVLVIDALRDSRRSPEDGPLLAAALTKAGAVVEHHSLPGDHGPVTRDIEIAHHWMRALP